MQKRFGVREGYGFQPDKKIAGAQWAVPGVEVDFKI